MRLHWDRMTSPEVARALADSPGTVALVPVGATEQHGPHLPLGTDTFIAEGIAALAAERAGAAVLPAITVACSYGHGTAFPGTLAVAPELLAATVRELAWWCAASGLRRLVLVNGHFGNRAALAIATDHLRLRRTDLQVGVFEWWAAAPDVAEVVTEDGEDVHANRAETALMLALAPDLVRTDLLAQADDPDRAGGLVFRYTAGALSTNGVTGSPSRATRELGEWLLGRVVDELVERVRRARSERPPLRGPAPATAPGGL